jgi:hypothetical protein
MFFHTEKVFLQYQFKEHGFWGKKIGNTQFLDFTASISIVSPLYESEDVTWASYILSISRLLDFTTVSNTWKVSLLYEPWDDLGLQTAHGSFKGKKEPKVS